MISSLYCTVLVLPQSLQSGAILQQSDVLPQEPRLLVSQVLVGIASCTLFTCSVILNYRCACVDSYRALVLRPDWEKPYYRCAEAWLRLGDVNTAVAMNKSGREACSERADLERQYKEIQDLITAARYCIGRGRVCQHCAFVWLTQDQTCGPSIHGCTLGIQTLTFELSSKRCGCISELCCLSPLVTPQQHWEKQPGRRGQRRGSI